MGFFDRKSVVTNEQDILNRNVAAENLEGVSVVGSENVNVLDGGAIGGIQHTAENAINANSGLVGESLDFGRNSLLAVGAAFETAANQTQRVLETTTGKGPSIITENTIKFGIAALVVAVAVFAFRK